MPAPRKQAPASLVAYLNSQAPIVPVSQALPLAKYYRSADLLQAQAAAYRAAQNEEQLYVILLRMASLVVETIPKHRQCDRRGAVYDKYRQQAINAAAEAEKLKIVLHTKDIRVPRMHTLRRPSSSVQVVDGRTLPDIDWHAAAAPPAAAAAAAAAGIPGTYIQQQQGQQQLQQPPPPQTSADAPSWAPVAYSSGTYVPSSAASLHRHALFAPRAAAGAAAAAAAVATAAPSSAAGAALRPRYPALDPSSATDALWSAPPGGSTLPDIGALSLQQQQHPQQQQQQQQQQQALLPAPSAGPSPAPLEVAVTSMSPSGGVADGTCTVVAPVSLPAVAEAAAAAAAAPKPPCARIDLRDVHISVALMNDFLHYAAANTRRGIESCGILAGRLSAADSRFTVTTLIVPKQKGTSDTVEMLSEEEVWEAESSRELVPLGWIHTHPSQTCFLSSVDIHTQCGYQTMLEESVAIVMAPTDPRSRCGIFRLTTPAGLEHVQRCGMRGFHAGCGSGHYELCGHVYLNPAAGHEVIDLR